MDDFIIPKYILGSFLVVSIVLALWGGMRSTGSFLLYDATTCQLSSQPEEECQYIKDYKQTTYTILWTALALGLLCIAGLAVLFYASSFKK